MDPLTALGTVANVIAIVDFGGKIVLLLKASYRVAHGRSQELDDIKALTSSLKTSLECLEQYHNQPASTAQSIFTNKCDDEVRTLSRQCQNLAQMILDHVARATPHLSGRMQITKAMWDYATSARKDIKVMVDRLHEYRQQLDTLILVSIRHEAITQLLSTQQLAAGLRSHEQQVIMGIRDGKKCFADLQESIRDLRQIVIDEAERTRALIAISGDQQVIDQIEKVHQSLIYEGWNHRQKQLDPAYGGTADWILEQPKHDKWPSLIDWLTGEDSKPIYWITGRPGAGKSTIVKALVERNAQRFRQLLSQQQSGPVPKVIVASHFFWDLGYPLAKDIQGMLRSILFQLLESQPHLKRNVLGPLHAVPNSDSNLSHDSWPKGMLVDAILGTISLLGPDSVLCFVLDGLDECSTNHDDLTRVLKRFAECGHRTRLLVASRPWADFNDAFGSKNLASKVFVHDHTASGIHGYIVENLNEIEAFARLSRTQPSETENLTAALGDRAYGVWAWVVIVIKTLRKLFRSGKAHNMRALWAEVEKLPEGLNDLYDHIIHRVDVVSVRECAVLLCLFSITNVAISHMKSPFRSLGSRDFFFAPFFQVAYRLAVCQPFSEYDLLPNTFHSSFGIEDFDDLVQNQTGGLLECGKISQFMFDDNNTKDKYLDTYGSFKISPFHLSVEQWLMKEGTRQKLCALLPVGLDLRLVARRASLSLVPPAVAVTAAPTAVTSDMGAQWLLLAMRSLFYDGSAFTEGELSLLKCNMLCCCRILALHRRVPVISEEDAWTGIYRFSDPDHLCLESVLDVPITYTHEQQSRLVSGCTVIAPILCAVIGRDVRPESPEEVCEASLYLGPLFDQASCADLSFVLIFVVSQLLPYNPSDPIIRFKTWPILPLLDHGADPDFAVKTLGCSAWACLLVWMSCWSGYLGEKYMTLATKFLESGAAEVETLTLPFRRASEAGAIPLACEYLRPSLLRQLAEYGLYEGSIMTDVQWEARQKAEGWSQFDFNEGLDKLGERHDRELACTYARSSELDQETREKRKVEYIKQRSEECKAILRKMAREGGSAAAMADIS